MRRKQKLRVANKSAVRREPAAVTGTGTQQLAALVDFAQFDLVAVGLAAARERLWRLSDPAVFLNKPAGLLVSGAYWRTATATDIADAQSQLRSKLEYLFPTDGSTPRTMATWTVGPSEIGLLWKEDRLVRVAVPQHCQQDSLWYSAQALLAEYGSRLSRCARSECRRLFVRTKRQNYCSPACSQRTRAAKYYAAHHDDISDQRRAKYVAIIQRRLPGARVGSRRGTALQGIATDSKTHGPKPPQAKGAPTKKARQSPRGVKRA